MQSKVSQTREIREYTIYIIKLSKKNFKIYSSPAMLILEKPEKHLLTKVFARQDTHLES